MEKEKNVIAPRIMQIVQFHKRSFNGREKQKINNISRTLNQNRTKNNGIDI